MMRIDPLALGQKLERLADMADAFAARLPNAAVSNNASTIFAQKSVQQLDATAFGVAPRL